MPANTTILLILIKFLTNRYYLEYDVAMPKKKMSIEDLALIIEKTVAKKEDLEGLATKEDLKRFATKEDIKNMATKDDIRRLETEIHEARHEIQGVKDELETVHEVVDRIDDKDLPNIKRRVSILEKITKPLIK